MNNKQLATKLLRFLAGLAACALLALAGAAVSKAPTPAQINLAMISAGVALALFAGLTFSVEAAKRKEALIGLGAVAAMAFLGASIFVPVFSSARAASANTTCISNVKRLGIAIQIYLADSNDFFPPSDRWLTRTRAYGAAEFHCPRATSPFSLCDE